VNKETTTLYRPVGPEELELIKQSDFKKFPPRLFYQPIFYPVTNFEYAEQIARDWNVPASGSGFVTQFEVETEYLAQFPIQNVGGINHNEYWIPAERPDEFNSHIVGDITIAKDYYAQKHNP
jgi:hypothetical protein